VLTLPPAARVYVATERRPPRLIDGLTALVHGRFDQDRQAGRLFVFRNRGGCDGDAQHSSPIYMMGKRSSRGSTWNAIAASART